MAPLSIYIHVPFCSYKCPYCDFNTYAVTSVPDGDYTDALLAELECYSAKPEFLGRSVSTIYFGGGTPSLLSSSSISRIISAVSERFSLAGEAEITLEANPEKLELGYLTGLRNSGVNRLSLGVQSFSDHILEKLGRGHRKDDVARTIDRARRAGFENISLDLIFAVPGQDISDLENDLQQAFKLSPEHISTYELTIEKGTPYYEGYERGVLIPAGEELTLEMMDLVQETLSGAGYKRYEISNYARAGFESKHNLNYWQVGDYLGLGAGAHSYLLNDKARRWSNFALPKKYMSACRESGQAVSWSEDLQESAQAFEFFFLGLRRVEGVSLDKFHERFGDKNYEIASNLALELKRADLACLADDRFRLSPSGLAVIDSILEAFSDSFAARIPADTLIAKPSLVTLSR